MVVIRVITGYHPPLGEDFARAADALQSLEFTLSNIVDHTENTLIRILIPIRYVEYQPEFLWNLSF